MICGGVCLGIANEHHVSDGFSAIHFINTWSNIARGGGIKVPPFFDRTILHAGDSPEPKFAHNEYHPPPPLVQTPETNNPNLNFTVFKLTLDQLNALKTSCSKEDHQNYSTYEVVSGHLWRCVTAARGLSRKSRRSCTSRSTGGPGSGRRCRQDISATWSSPLRRLLHAAS